MQELLKKKREIDRLYNEARSMELTMDTAAQSVIEQALDSIADVFDQIDSSFGAFMTGTCGLSVTRQGAKGDMCWVLQIGVSPLPSVTYLRRNGKWISNMPNLEQKVKAAKCIMDGWQYFSCKVKADIEAAIKRDMKSKIDDVERMVNFLQKAESFKI